MLLWQIYVARNYKTYVGLYVNWPVLRLRMLAFFRRTVWLNAS
jgi:hypothetical protein